MNNSKTNIGISAGLIGAALYLTLLFGGYTPFLFLAAYVFLKEDNAWLKKIAVKAFTLSICLSLLAEAVGLIPDAISLVDRLFSIFKGSFSIPFISRNPKQTLLVRQPPAFWTQRLPVLNSTLFFKTQQKAAARTYGTATQNLDNPSKTGYTTNKEGAGPTNG